MPDQSTPSPRWLPPQPAADYLGIGLRTLQRLAESGALRPSYALGPRSPRYDRFALDRYMAGDGAPIEPLLADAG